MQNLFSQYKAFKVDERIDLPQGNSTIKKQITDGSASKDNDSGKMMGKVTQKLPVVDTGELNTIKDVPAIEKIKPVPLDNKQKSTVNDDPKIVTTDTIKLPKLPKFPKDVNERILEPQGHVESPDPISDGSKRNGMAPKKMMGNRTPMEVIARILAGKR